MTTTKPKLDPKKVFFVPYRTGSESIELLTERLGIKSVKIDGTSKVLANPTGKVLIFWGKPPSEAVYNSRSNFIALNSPTCIEYALNKKKFFDRIAQQNYCLEYTTEESVARDWIEEDESKVVARETVTGMGGEGITVIKSLDEWPTDKSFALYTKYVPKKAEYRVHVIDGQVVTVSKKVMPTGSTPVSGWEIRSHDNGFIFQREDKTNVPVNVLDAAVHSVVRCGLTFAGVDVLWNEKRKRAYVCEINSAPGIEGSTVEAYASAFEEMIPRYMRDYGF